MNKSILKIITLLTLFTFPTTLLASCNNRPQVITKIYEYFDGKGNVYPKYLPPDTTKIDYTLLTKKPISPSEAEVEENLRSKPAKLRVIQKKGV